MKAVFLARRDGSLQGEVLVDDDDYERLGNWSWFLHRSGYVTVFVPGVGRKGRGVKGPGHYAYLHRLVMGCRRGDGMVVDHISGDKLDNRRENLRVLTQRHNKQNVCGYGKYSRHRGVSFDKSRGKWIAYLKIPGGRLTMLGRFDSEADAATAAAAARAEHMPYAVAR